MLARRFPPTPCGLDRSLGQGSRGRFTACLREDDDPVLVGAEQVAGPKALVGEIAGRPGHRRSPRSTWTGGLQRSGGHADAETVKWAALGLAAALVAIGGWLSLATGVDATVAATDATVSAVTGTVGESELIAAQASLAAQRAATGTYADASVQSPVTLVRADATAYCLQLDRPGLQLHAVGPNGTIQPGPC